MKRILIPALMLMLTSCTSVGAEQIRYEYGVFLGLGSEDTGKMEDYRIIVLEAQYFTEEQIHSLKDTGHTVLSYINVGALENFRPYYGSYEKFTLDVYENWEEEKWVDVSAPEWQGFMSELSQQLLGKGCDGLFVDNTDVYYHYHRDEIFDGLTEILSGFKEQGAYVSVNGGDVYLSEYMDRYGELPVTDAVNQETVWSSIDFDSGTFGKNPDEERAYFTDYLSRIKGMGKDVYLLEYTTDQALIKKIAGFCDDRGYT